jgi:hypothetical protein
MTFETSMVIDSEVYVGAAEEGGMQVLGPAEESFDTQEFPCTAGEFVEAHGSVELELPNGAETLSDALSCLPSDERFRTREDARLAVCNGLGEAAIGRKAYSDRDPACPGETGHDRVSL